MLYPGLQADKVAARHRRYAEALMAASFTFELLTPELSDDVEALITGLAPTPDPDSKTLVPFHVGDQDAGLVALNDAGEIVAALVVTAVDFSSGNQQEQSPTALFIRGLATDPDFRGKGLGTVLLGMAPQILKQAGLPTRCRLITQIPQERATFFHRAGFQVWEHGTETPQSVTDMMETLLPRVADEPCLTFREVA